MLNIIKIDNIVKVFLVVLIIKINFKKIYVFMKINRIIIELN